MCLEMFWIYSGFVGKNLTNYLKRNTLVNKKNADKYIEKLLNEKL